MLKSNNFTKVDDFFFFYKCLLWNVIFYRNKITPCFVLKIWNFHKIRLNSFAFPRYEKPYLLMYCTPIRFGQMNDLVLKLLIDSKCPIKSTIPSNHLELISFVMLSSLETSHKFCYADTFFFAFVIFLSTLVKLERNDANLSIINKSLLIIYAFSRYFSWYFRICFSVTLRYVS